MWDVSNESTRTEYDNFSDIVYLLEKVKRDVRQLELLIEAQHSFCATRTTQEKKEG